MASQALPLVQAGSFAFSETLNIKFTSARLVSDDNVRFVTGSGDGHHVMIHGMPVVQVAFQGVIRAASGGAYGLGQSSTFDPDIEACAYDWVVAKQWQLVDATCSGHTEKNWSWRIPTLGINVRGHLLSGFDEAEFQSNMLNVSITMDQFGTLAGILARQRMVIDANFSAGGPVPFNYNGVISGAPTYTGTAFSWLFPAENDPVKGGVTLDLDVAEDFEHAAILNQIEIRASAQDGGELPVRGILTFDEADAEE